jgi:hypothetical protein
MSPEQSNRLRGAALGVVGEADDTAARVAAQVRAARTSVFRAFARSEASGVDWTDHADDSAARSAAAASPRRHLN